MSSSAIDARRWITVAVPLLAGLFLLMGAVADPAPALDGRELTEAYAAASDRVQLKSFGYHFGFGLICALVFLLAARLRGRGAWLANIAVVLAFLGITTMPGFILSDFYDAAIGQTVGLDAYDQISTVMEGMWALTFMAVTGALGMLLSVVLVAVAAWRGRLVPWWGAVLPAAATAAFFAAANEIGATIAAVLFAAFSWVLARALPRSASGPDV